jgi:hypothetical protein
LNLWKRFEPDFSKESILEKAKRRSQELLKLRKDPRRQPSPGVTCPYLRDPAGLRFNCKIHRDPQAQATNDWFCKKICLPKGGPHKTTARAFGIPPIQFRGLGIKKNYLPRNPSTSPSHLAAQAQPPRRRSRFGRKVA